MGPRPEPRPAEASPARRLLRSLLSGAAARSRLANRPAAERCQRPVPWPPPASVFSLVRGPPPPPEPRPVGTRPPSAAAALARAAGAPSASRAPLHPPPAGHSVERRGAGAATLAGDER